MTDSLRERVIAACSARPRSVEAYRSAASASDATRISRPGCAADMRDHRGLPPQQAAHWDTVTLDGSVLEDELLDHFYELVVARLPRAERGKLNT
jgi:hypothetical protein